MPYIKGMEQERKEIIRKAEYPRGGFAVAGIAGVAIGTWKLYKWLDEKGKQTKEFEPQDCWPMCGSGSEKQKTKTTVRLYEPVGLLIAGTALTAIGLIPSTTVTLTNGTVISAVPVTSDRLGVRVAFSF